MSDSTEQFLPAEAPKSQPKAQPESREINFRIGEVFPLRGVNFAVAAVQGDKIVLQAVGLTGKTQKRIEAASRRRPIVAPKGA